MAAAGGPADRNRASSGATRRRGSGRLAAPMQGTIIKVVASVGERVTIGSPLVVLEAMKMENTLTSDVDGVVTELSVVPGATVAPGQLLAVVAADPDIEE
jgi:biotin carboxyl carrier protein